MYGTDYDTPDGTCVRDYVHVSDLADAHVLALEALQKGAASRAYNLGNGRGFSVRQVIDAAERVTGKRIAVTEAARREGDPAELVGDASRIRRELGWQPRIGRIEDIISSAWRWYLKGPPMDVETTNAD